jgi:type IV pilus assembly protein PilM
MIFNKQKSWLGVDLGAGGIKLVELKEEKGRPTLFTYGLTTEKQAIHSIIPVNPKTPDNLKIDQIDGIQNDKKPLPKIKIDDSEINKIANSLKEVCAKAMVRSKNAMVSLPVSSVFHSIVTLPKDVKGDLQAILRAEIKKLLPYPAEDMILDYQVLENFSDARYKRIMVNATPKAVVEFYTRIFQKAGLHLDSLEPESTALERALIGRDTAVAMLVDMGAERTNFFIIDRSAPITHHTIESGGHKVNAILQNILSVENKNIGQIRKDLFKYYLSGNRDNLVKENFLKIMDPIFDPIKKQIEYSFDLYLHQTGNENKTPEKIILTGGAAMLPYLADSLAETFNLKCYLGDPWARVVYQDGLKSLLGDIGPRMSVAVGLALRYLVK